VFVVPGDGGSQLFAKLDREEVPHFYCEKKSSGYFNIWLNLAELSLPIDCFVDNMR
jgi:lysophospholipase-3